VHNKEIERASAALHVPPLVSCFQDCQNNEEEGTETRKHQGRSCYCTDGMGVLESTGRPTCTRQSWREVRELRLFWSPRASFGLLGDVCPWLPKEWQKERGRGGGADPVIPQRARPLSFELGATFFNWVPPFSLRFGRKSTGGVTTK
jgi:hypothetical protein